MCCICSADICGLPSEPSQVHHRAIFFLFSRMFFHYFLFNYLKHVGMSQLPTYEQVSQIPIWQVMERSTQTFLLSINNRYYLPSCGLSHHPSHFIIGKVWIHGPLPSPYSQEKVELKKFEHCSGYLSSYPLCPMQQV